MSNIVRKVTTTKSGQTIKQISSPICSSVKRALWLKPKDQQFSGLGLAGFGLLNTSYPFTCQHHFDYCDLNITLLKIHGILLEERCKFRGTFR